MIHESAASDRWPETHDSRAERLSQDRIMEDRIIKRVGMILSRHRT
jgi:hypothetical protein